MNATDERRSHGRSPWRDAFEMLALRPSRGEPISDVTITRNAKGVYQFEVTARGASVTGCRELAQYEADALEARYPYPLEAPVSPQEYAEAITEGNLRPETAKLPRARGKAEKA